VQTLRVATFLAPSMRPVYAAIARHLSKKLEVRVRFFVGSSYRQLASEVDVAFVCGLAYVELTRKRALDLEPVAAPVLTDQRYGGKPIYYSDVIVRQDSGFRSFTDLRGCSWSYNEPFSHSGYGITRYQLAVRGETSAFFGRMIAAGYHSRSIRWVYQGKVDAAAIDSHVLALALRDDVALRSHVRVLESWGPSSIQPVVVSRRLSIHLRHNLRSIFAALHEEPTVSDWLSRGMVQRFVSMRDADYDDIRRMRDISEATFPALARRNL
jgi:phosphonate transport system substrate-binding protein